MNRHLWRRKLAAIQEWGGVERACIPAVLLVLTFMHYGVWVAALLHWDRDGSLIHRAEALAAIPMVLFWMAGGTLISLLGLFLRKRSPDAEWFMHLSAIFYAFSQVWGGYVIGPLSFVVGILMTGAPLVGFIILTRRVTVVASVVAFLLILGINLATAHGQLPYAPLLREPYDTHSALLWTHSQLFLAAPHILCLGLLSYLVLGHWRRREGEVLAQSLTDALTGVHNRRSILDLLERELARTRRHGSSLAIVLLDLDHFKRINDRFGHPTGDRALQEAARVLRGCVRQCDAIGRFGGEEFLLLLPDTTWAGARQLAERCRSALAELTLTADSGERVPVTASFGVACNENAAPATVEQLVRSADAALYRAKQAGRDRVVLGAMPELRADSPAPAAATPAPAVWEGRLRRLSTVSDTALPQHVDGRPWWHSLAGWQHRVASTREWSPVAKCGLIMFLLIVLRTGGLLWLHYMLLRPDSAQMLDTQVAGRMIWALSLGLVVAYALLLASLWLRRRHPDARWFQHFSLQYFSLSLILEGYALGIMYLPTGVIFACAPLLGFILFRRVIVLWVWGVAMAAVVVLAYACALGWLPYAPLLSLGRAAYHLHEPFWIYSAYLFYLPTLLVVLVLVDQVLGRWREREAQIHAVNLTDMLTRVHNRRSILALLETEVQRSARQGTPLTVALLDLDHFKAINDTWGHPTGDRVLREAARVLKDCMRECDAIGRVGGEEFLLLLPATSPEGARALVERCREALTQTRITADNGDTLTISASFGMITSTAPEPLDAAALTRLADSALYRAKENGRNRVEMALA